jgi:hypothetical protein
MYVLNVMQMFIEWVRSQIVQSGLASIFQISGFEMKIKSNITKACCVTTAWFGRFSARASLQTAANARR